MRCHQVAGPLTLWLVALVIGCADPAADFCPDDPAKLEPGACGCGVSDDDANRNGVPDCFDAGIDLCPDDSSKIESGVCGCGVSDADSNGNGVPDCLDDAVDLCPGDSSKVSAGTCGCGVSDADTNRNGVPDCLDPGIDLCPDDPLKTQAGVCGCGKSDVDANANNLPDCYEHGAASVTYISEFTFSTNSNSIASYLAVINTTPQAMDLSTAKIVNVVLKNPGTKLVPSVVFASGILPVGLRTDSLSPVAKSVLGSAGFTPESVASGAILNLGLSSTSVVAGDQQLEFTLDIDGYRTALTILAHYVPGASTVLTRPTRATSVLKFGL